MRDEIIKLLGFTKLNKKELAELIEIPRELKMGDYAFPCFSLARKFKKNPKEIAIDIASKVKSNKNTENQRFSVSSTSKKRRKVADFEKVEAVGGYVNFFVNRVKFAEGVIGKVSKEGDKYGSGTPKENNEKVMVEFSQPNTHKAFHVGHIRGTALGESLSRILEFSGNKVTRANYSGDTGMHVAAWLWAYNKYHKKEKIKEDETWFAKIYVEAVSKLQDEKVRKEIEKINQKLDSRKDKALNALWKETRKLSIKSWEKIYHELNTRFDVNFFESEVEKRGKAISKELVKKKIAEISDGATIVDLENYGLSVWVLLRKDGTVLYSAKDLALAEKKFKEHKINRSVYVVGTEQRLHVHQLFKTLDLMGFKQASRCAYAPVSLVRLPWGKMSSRTGDNILYSDFKKQLQEYAIKEIEKRGNIESVELYDRSLAIAIASMKYSMLKQDPNRVIIFDPKKSISFEGDTGPYLLYSYARAQSILEKAGYKKQKKAVIKEVDEYEKRLLSEIARFPDMVKKSYNNLSPNLIANYSYELAKVFSEFYHNTPVIGSGAKEQFRLKLADSFSQTIKNALWLLGIFVIEKM